MSASFRTTVVAIIAGVAVVLAKVSRTTDIGVLIKKARARGEDFP